MSAQVTFIKTKSKNCQKLDEAILGSHIVNIMRFTFEKTNFKWCEIKMRWEL